MNGSLTHCRVCDYDNDFAIWGEDGQSSSHDICPCCGVEFGYEDFTQEGILRYRQKWLTDGAKWFSRRHKPENWDLDEQLKHIPPEYV